MVNGLSPVPTCNILYSCLNLSLTNSISFLPNPCFCSSGATAIFFISKILFPSSVITHSAFTLPLYFKINILPSGRYLSIILSCSSAKSNKGKYSFLFSYISNISINYPLPIYLKSSCSKTSFARLYETSVHLFSLQ